MNQSLLHTNKLLIGYFSKSSKKVVLSGIDIQLKAGEMVCLLGPNGVGKSTLLRTLAGVQPALAGQVFIANKLIGNLNRLELAQKISLVLTDRNFSGNLNVLDLISLGRYPHTSWSGNFRPEDYAKIEEAVEQTQVGYLLNQKLHEISDGQLQKAMIARAVAQDGDIMILDEPTAHLDLSNKIEILLLLKKLVRNMNKAVIIATHELDLALKTADQIWLAQCNEPIINGMPEELALQGVLDKIYGGKDYHINSMTGQVQIKTTNQISIQILEHNTLSYWTANALRRNGFNPTAEPCDLKIEVFARNGAEEWHLLQKENFKKFTSLKTLLQHLDNYHHNYE